MMLESSRTYCCTAELSDALFIMISNLQMFYILHKTRRIVSQPHSLPLLNIYCALPYVALRGFAGYEHKVCVGFLGEKIMSLPLCPAEQQTAVI